MKKDKDPERAMALLVLAQSGRDLGAAGVCPNPEDIAAVAEGLFPWERRHQVMRHLAVCPACYRTWLEVARSAGGPPLVWRWRPWSARGLIYVGGVLAAIVCLALFWYWPRPPEETVFRQQSAPPPIAKNKESEPKPAAGEKLPAAAPKPEAGEKPPAAAPKPAVGEKPPAAAPKPVAGEPPPAAAPKPAVGEKPPSPTAPGGNGPPTAADDAVKPGPVALNTGIADTRRQASGAKENNMIAEAMAAPIKIEDHRPMAVGVTADEGRTEAKSKPPAAKPSGSIRIGTIEMQRSELAVWYGDLWEMCRLPGFVPDQWNSLHARGIDILQALSGGGQEEEIDRLWLMLGQIEGLTAERRKNFCAWSDKELTRKWEKERKNAQRPR